MVGYENPSLLVQQESRYSKNLYIYSTNITRVEQAHPGSICAVFDPSIRGGSKSKNCDSARMQCVATSSPHAPTPGGISKGTVPFLRHCSPSSHHGRGWHIGAKIRYISLTR